MSIMDEQEKARQQRVLARHSEWGGGVAHSFDEIESARLKQWSQVPPVEPNI